MFHFDSLFKLAWYGWCRKNFNYISNCLGTPNHRLGLLCQRHWPLTKAKSLLIQHATEGNTSCGYREDKNFERNKRKWFVKGRGNLQFRKCCLFQGDAIHINPILGAGARTDSYIGHSHSHIISLTHSNPSSFQHYLKLLRSPIYLRGMSGSTNLRWIYLPVLIAYLRWSRQGCLSHFNPGI